MLFTGSTELNIDAKGRLSVPSRYRSQLTENDNTDADQKGQPKQKQVWITLPWTDGSIRLYTEQMFTELASQWTDSLTLNEDQAKLRRIIFGSAERIEADSAGRIRVPQEHLDQAEIGSAVAVVGAGSWLEIRDQQQWRDERRRLAGELPGLIERTRSSE